MQSQGFQNSSRARALVAASFLLIGAVVANWPTPARGQSAYPSTGVRAVPTYEAVGLYWSNPGANVTTGCEVKFRKSSESAWTAGLAMWFDARNSECRGSLVNLAPGTDYEAQFNLPGAGVTRGLTFTTWSNQVPVASVTALGSGSATYNVTQGGSASGYIESSSTSTPLEG